MNMATQQFITACKAGDLETVKKLYEYDNTINIHVANEEVFKDTCENGHLEVVKFLWELDQNINIDAFEDAFTNACASGNLELVKYLWNLNQDIDLKECIFSEPDFFHELCEKEYLDIIKFLIKIYNTTHKNKLEISLFQFGSACSSGNLELVKYLWEYNNNNINLYCNDYYDLLGKLCFHGTTYEIIKFLWDIGLYVDLIYDVNEAFSVACQFGHLGIVKSLWELDKNINIHAANDTAFRNACSNGKLDVVKYLMSICNDYVVEFNKDNTKIVKYYIRNNDDL